MVRVGTDKKANDLKAGHCGQKCGSICLTHRNAKRSKGGQSRDQSSKMREVCVVFSLCPVDFNMIRPGKPVVQLENRRRNMFVLLRPTNLWGYAWKGLRTKTMKTTSQEEIWIHWVTITWCTNLILCLKPWKYQMQWQQWKNKGKKLEKIPAWQLTKVSNENEVVAAARNEGRKVHFASLMDLCHLKNSELEPQFQKYKGRLNSEVTL